MARRLAVALGTLFTVLAVGWSALSFVSWASTRQASLDRDFTGIQTVRASTDVGDIVVSAGPAGGVTRVVARSSYGLLRPQVDVSTVGDVLKVRAECRSGPLPDRCRVDLELLLPVDADLLADVDVGTIRVTGAGGDLDLDSDTGSILAVELRSGVVRAASDVGDVRLAFAVAPRTVSAQSDVGDASIDVPAGSAYDATADTDVGDTSIEVPVDITSARRLSVSCDVGDARIGVSPR